MQKAREICIVGMFVTEIRGFGRQRSYREVYRGAEYRIDFVPRLKSKSQSKTTTKTALLAPWLKHPSRVKWETIKVFSSPIQDAHELRQGKVPSIHRMDRRGKTASLPRRSVVFGEIALFTLPNRSILFS